MIINYNYTGNKTVSKIVLLNNVTKLFGFEDRKGRIFGLTGV